MLMELSEVANNYIRAACWKDHYDYSVKNASEFGGHLGENSGLRVWTF